METEHNWKERTEVTLEYSEKWKNTNKINDTEDCHKVSRTTITSSGSKRKKKVKSSSENLLDTV